MPARRSPLKRQLRSALNESGGSCWHRDDEDGDAIVLYTPAVDRLALGVQNRRSDVGFAVLLDAEALDALITELQDRRSRMPAPCCDGEAYCAEHNRGGRLP